jgi:hypothetical protein
MKKSEASAKFHSKVLNTPGRDQENLGKRESDIAPHILRAYRYNHQFRIGIFRNVSNSEQIFPDTEYIKYRIQQGIKLDA